MSGLLQCVSLFAGIGGIDLGMERAGIPTVAQVEIDPRARSVLARHFPHAARFDDVTKVTGDDLRDVGAVPGRTVLAGGFPCQDVSVAGRRAGLAGERSGLFWHVVRLLAEFRPAWVLVENVPGLLSSNGGRDMGTVVGELGRLGYGWAFRVLDAQFFGVAQRRRRVFIVGCAGDGSGPVEVLLEPEGGAGDFAPRRASGPGTTRGARGGAGGVVNALTRNGLGGGGPDDNNAQGGHLLVADTLTAGVSGPGVNPPGRRQEDDTNLVVARESGPGYWSEDNDAAGPLRHRDHKDHGSTLITHALTTQARGVTEDGTGRGTPIVAFAWQAGGNNDASGAFKDDGTTPCLPRSQTLAVCAPLTAAMGGNAGAPGNAGMDELATATASIGGAVRRLMPVECERLQGFPDGWTELDADGKPQADSTRYRQLGNAVAVPCAEWIAHRIAAHVTERVA